MNRQLDAVRGALAGCAGRMRMTCLGAALLAGAVATPAAAQTVRLISYCTLTDAGRTFVSRDSYSATLPADVRFAPRRQMIEQQFRAAVARAHNLTDPRPSCSDFNVTLSDGSTDQSMLERFERDFARAKSTAGAVLVAFTPGESGAVASAPPPSPPPRSSTQTAALTVKTDTGPRDAAEAWDEQVKTSLAAEAQKKVETAAKAAQANAKYQADMAKFFAERRKQGRAQ